MSASDVRPMQPVIIQLDKQYQLIFDWNAVALIEELYGGFEQALNQAAHKSGTVLRDLVWAGIAHAHTDFKTGEVGMSRFEVGRCLSNANLIEVQKKVMRAYAQSLPAEVRNEMLPYLDTVDATIEEALSKLDLTQALSVTSQALVNHVQAQSGLPEADMDPEAPAEGKVEDTPTV